jgi:hypothetical protein
VDLVEFHPVVPHVRDGRVFDQDRTGDVSLSGADRLGGCPHHRSIRSREQRTPLKTAGDQRSVSRHQIFSKILRD